MNVEMQHAKMLCASVAALLVGFAFADAVRVSNRLQVMWDDFIVDTTRTTATKSLHRPEPMEVVMTMDRPWEGDACSYLCILPDEDAKGRFFRMYYIGSRFPTPAEVEAQNGSWHQALCRQLKACYAESRDGIHWTRPELGICEFEGSRRNNIIADNSWGFPVDNWFVFKDMRPGCPANERYKALARVTKGAAFAPDGKILMEDGANKDGPFLWCFLSADGIHFRKGDLVTAKGAFDSLNTVYRNEQTGEYHLYTRGFHRIEKDRNGDNWARDIRHSVSKDFRTWTVPQLLEYTDGAEEYPLYTNLAQPYYRNPEIVVAFPTRYVERREWTDNYEKLPSPSARKKHMEFKKRMGLAMTDCIFMMSRDGMHFERCNEGFISPGPEFAYNWVYGDCYPAYGFLLSAGRYPGSDDELSFLVFENSQSGKPLAVRRMRLRQDGFISRQATYREQVVVTKPLVFSGKEMLVNFSTSARGYVYVTILDEAGKELKSCELFGDRVDRVVGFVNGSVADFEGKVVTVKFRMSDADLYSFRFR